MPETRAASAFKPKEKVMEPDKLRAWFLSFMASLAFLLAFCLARPGPAQAEGPTLVSGIISNPTTWAASASPYIVTGNILVSRPATLTIESGVTVKFAGPYSLKVEGTKEDVFEQIVRFTLWEEYLAMRDLLNSLAEEAGHFAPTQTETRRSV